MKNRMTQVIAGATFAVGVAVATGPAFAQDADWPTSQINLVVTFGPGGSADRTARALAPELQEELGVPVNVINQDGGGGHVGFTYFTNMPADGSHFLLTSLNPYLANAIQDFDADYSLSDFAFINTQWNDSDVFAVNADTPYETLSGFMEAAKENPGELRVSVVPGSTGEINIKLAMEAFDVPSDAINIVTYESGGAARTAVAGGQVDMTVISADGTIPIAEQVRPLAVASTAPLPDWEAPTLNTVLQENDLETVPVLLGSMRGMAAHAEFKEDHPDLYERMVETYRTILEDEEFVASLETQDIGAEWLGPEETTKIIEENAEVLERFSGPDS
ncbi:Bug family tripartite tricarboxylate transporter substrate binding protein [Citreimonas sp.]|uniref:Bug family tripartite tricarboxylate transporter substrate binding protein n=1 Tax=Citreimonas sp. TaxID=3036715 RepID=UPI004057E605